MFPAPSVPAAYLTDQETITEGFLRYEDVTQDGRLMPIAVPPSLGGLWRGVLVKHPGARASQQEGIIPMLTRLTIRSHDRAIRVDKPVQTHSGFELARDPESTRLFMNVWCQIRGLAGRIVPRETPGEPTLAGEVFAEHVFTRPFGPPDQRRVTRLGNGYPDIPETVYAAPPASSAAEAPEGATWLDQLAPDGTEVAFTLDQTDSNQHVNSLVYIRIFLDAVQRRLAAGGKPLMLRSTAVDIGFRKPCFAGDRVRAHLRLFDRAGTIGAAGFVATIGDEQKPRCYVRVLVGP
jgi:hypothetical protein